MWIIYILISILKINSLQNFERIVKIRDWLIITEKCIFYTLRDREKITWCAHFRATSRPVIPVILHPPRGWSQSYKYTYCTGDHRWSRRILSSIVSIDICLDVIYINIKYKIGFLIKYRRCSFRKIFLNV